VTAQQADNDAVTTAGQPVVRASLRALIVEDSADDTRFIVRELEQNGYEVEFQQVDEPATFRAALGLRWDVVICDYNLPNFSGPAALEILSETGIDLPLLIVSGTIGEDAAVEAMRAGARDYVLKDNLRRLAPAVRRELREARSRLARREAERALEHAQKLDSIGKLKKGAQVTCEVMAVQDSGIEVKLADTDITTFIKRSDLSRDRSEQRPERFNVGDKVDAAVTSLDKSSRRVTVSIKALEIAEEKQAVAQYGSSDSGASLGDIFKAAIKKKEGAEEKKDDEETPPS